jgi:hypothetical protein
VSAAAAAPKATAAVPVKAKAISKLSVKAAAKKTRAR